jgi:ketosteroid isomerase-like protein
MNGNDVMTWVAAYERAWRHADLDALGTLFTHDATYSPAPYDETMRGLDAIRDFWLDDEDDTFTVDTSLVAADDRHAVVRLEVSYGDPIRQEYRDLWVLHFAPDGRVDAFEEWPFWPGKGAEPSR